MKDSNCDTFKIFEDPFKEDEFNPAETLEKQLEKDPIPETAILNSGFSDCLCIQEEENVSDIELGNDLFIINDTIEPTLAQTWSNETKKPSETLKPSQNKIEKKDTKSSRKKLTEFGYLLQRKGFRLMRKYYKEKFEKYAQQFNYKKRVKKISSEELTKLMVQFAQIEFCSILPVIPGNEFSEIINNLKRIVLSDRSNKKEPMINGIDFSSVKNLLAKYTQKSMKKFLQVSSNSFLYTHFYLINGRSA